MGLKHSTTVTGTNDPTKQVSVNAWNSDHVITDYLDFPQLGVAPAAPSTGIRLYAHDMAGRQLLDMSNPTGADVSLQPAMFSNSVSVYLPNTGTTAAINFGTPWTNTGTAAHPTIANTSLLTSMKRTTFSTGSTTGTAAGTRAAQAMTSLSATALQGGFFYAARVAVETYVQASTQLMIGMTASTTNTDLNGNPSARFNHISVGKDSADTTWQLMVNDGVGTATKTNSGVTMAAGDILDIYMYARAGGGQNVVVSAARVNDGAIIFDNVSVTTDLPANGTMLYPIAEIRNSTGTSLLLAVSRLYLEVAV